MIVVSNATPLIAMAMADQFDVLHRIFGRIYIPPGVYTEVVEEGGERFGATEMRQAAWIQVIEARDKLAIEVWKMTWARERVRPLSWHGKCKPTGFWWRNDLPDES
jgi:predicted nucleic acid-binding protein